MLREILSIRQGAVDREISSTRFVNNDPIIYEQIQLIFIIYYSIALFIFSSLSFCIFNVCNIENLNI